MKLVEIFDMTPVKTTRDVSDHRGRHVMSGGSEVLGAGGFATALKNKSDKRIGTVYKIGSAAQLDPRHRNGLRLVKTPKEDAYLSYLEMIDSLDHVNPFFPKIYGLKVFQDPSGNIFYQVEMEKLTDLNKIDPQMSSDMMDRYFAEDSFIRKETDNIGYALLMVSDVEAYRDSILDETLREALDLIEHRVIPLGFRWDLGSNNVMVRLTSVGPQLVFTDPVA